MLPKISVIIPAANEERYIGRAILSIVAQDYPHVEIVVVANGSSDNTEYIARALGARTLYFPDLLGYSMARNKGAGGHWRTLCFFGCR